MWCIDICAGVCVFKMDLFTPVTLVSVVTLLLLLGYCLNWLITQQLANHRAVLDDLKTLMIFGGFSYCLSPVLVSLTETIATDTIYAMTTIMLLANLCFHDYGTDAQMASGVLSLNTSLFASVCLASRLHSTQHAFATVTFAVGVFSLWPALRRNIQQLYPFLHDILTFVLSIATVTAVTFLSGTAAILLTIAIVFITFICPAWLVSLQHYKNNIHGPWDEAVIKE